jgi:hypothetical protein
MTAGKIFERLWNFRQEFDRVILNRARNSADLSIDFGSDGHRTEPHERVHQSMRETLQAVTVFHDALALNLIQHFAHLLRRELVMIQE